MKEIIDIRSKLMDICRDIGINNVDYSFQDAGLTSFEYIQILVALEREFNIEFKEEVLVIDYFENIDSLAVYIAHDLGK